MTPPRVNGSAPAVKAKGKGRRLRTFEVWEQLPSVKAESEEDARERLPKGTRVFDIREAGE